LLKREIEMIAALTGKRRVSHLHFGGGTPNILGEQDIRDLFGWLKTNFNFDSVGEIAVELDPREVTQAQAKTLADCGVTRVSLGVQDFDAAVQTIIHRHQPYELVAQACDWLREAGIPRINLDLIYGLPKQTPQTVADTATRACTLNPDRIALFSYAHVPQMKKHQKVLEEHGLPDIHERLALEQTVRAILTTNGYNPLGIDHFAKDEDPIMQARRENRLNRNFQGYTEDGAQTLIGLGASSISQTADGYFQNEHDERAYQSALAAGRLPVRRGFLLSHEDRVRRAIIEQLMCTLSCDVEALCQEHQFDIEKLADDFKRLKPYEDAGIISRKGYTVRLTTPHRMAVRVICKVFDDYSRHSQALSSRTA
jgi:oxygen-independent coproporphyrinogen-3 oxidase